MKCPRDNGKENGNYRDYRGYIGIIGYILGLYRDNGKENGNYYIWLYRDSDLYWGYIGVILYPIITTALQALTLVPRPLEI